MISENFSRKHSLFQVFYEFYDKFMFGDRYMLYRLMTLDLRFTMYYNGFKLNFKLYRKDKLIWP